MQKSRISKDKKRLIIIQNINSCQLKELYLENAELLCINVDSMLKLQKESLPFITFYDYYGKEEYLEQLKLKHIELEKIFKGLDNKYVHLINYPHVFMGNFYIFSVVLADLIFISEIISVLKNIYKDVYIYTGYEKLDLRTYLNDLTIDFFDPFNIIKNRDLFIACLLQKGLNADLVISRLEEKDKPPGKIDFYLSVIMNSSKRLLANYFIASLRNIHLKKNRNKKVIFTVDLNYEPSYLQEFLGEYQLINPLRTINKNSLTKSNVPDFLTNEVSDEIKNLTSLRDDTFLDILKKYLRDVISFIPSFLDIVNLKNQEYKPSCIFFSFGQINILENILCYISNKDGLLVFNFQHGDDFEFVADEFDEFRHNVLNPNNKKTWILRSRQQYEFLNKNEHTNTKFVYGGNCKIFTYSSRLPDKIAKRNRKILFLVGHYPADGYMGLAYTKTDQDILSKHNSIFSIFGKYNVTVDIKLFPHNKYINYFRNMIKIHDIRRAKVISQPSAEFLLPNYDLIIMESLGSSLTPLLMILRVPVIYWVDKDHIRENVYQDFSRRHYLVTNEKAFESMIKQFKEDKLASKYDEELVKTYCFPSFTSNPAKNIIEYIEKNIMENS